MRRCSKMGLNRGPWTPQEDDLLLTYIQKKGEGSWRTLPMKAGLMRCGKSCRLRWMNYLRPDVKRGKISPDEEDLILRMHRLVGNRWSLIAGRIPGRTDNEIKNFWNTHLSKKLISQGVDPRTHKPLSESELVNDNEDNNLSQGASYENTYPQTANVLADKNEVAENNNSPGHLNATELPEILKIPNHAFSDAPISSFQDSVYTCEQNSYSDNNVAMNQTFIPHPNTTLEYEQDVLTRNTIHNSYFLPPALPDLICQENIPHQNQSNRFCSSIKETNPHKGFPLGFEQIEIQQHQILPHATTEDQYMHNSDILLSYFLEASMNDPQFNIGGTNKHAAAFLSENRQRFSETELMNRIGYNLWSIIFPPSQHPFSFS